MTRGVLDDESKRSLIEWYRDNHRALPWRDTRDPYRILVSEVMLQQTQAERVIPKYHAFLDRFPTLHALAEAPASEVIRAWSGLGYNRRALNLQRAARAVVELHGGVMPRDPSELAQLPGIGPYTAGAIACFAFEQDIGFFDTNIRRVLHRVVAGPELPEPRMSNRELTNLAAELVPPGEGYSWNQALMELGATLCRARSTDCERCPLEAVCLARPVIQQLLAERPRGRRAPEPRFETTSRYFRGRIVAALGSATDRGLSFEELLQTAFPSSNGVEPPVLSEYLRGLLRDGLIVHDREGTTAGVAESAAQYDAGVYANDDRFRLPD